MSRKWGAFATILMLILLAPALKTFLETLVGETETAVGGFPFIVNFIFSNLPLILIVATFGAAIMVILRTNKNKGGRF